MPRLLFTIFFAAVLVGLLPAAHAQQKQRPRVGLVLEGGGALGLAHIGVIEWLEENRIPVDYVAGTSMGGLVGGLYASGKSPREMRRIIGEMDWERVLSGQVPFRELAYRRKEDRLAYPNRLELGLRGGVSLPGGLNSGHEIGLVLTRETLAYPSLNSFDELPIPFRCVAADLVSGKAKVFDSGSLSDALRATMSLPALFSPVTGKEEIYADGGLLNNLPVDVVKGMGADVTIAVYLNTGPADPKTLRSLTGVLSRSISVMIGANELANIEKADVLVSVDLKGFTATDYAKGEIIADRGYEAAKPKANLLRHFSVDEEEWKSYLDDRQRRLRIPAKTIDFIEVSATDGPVKAAVEQSLAHLAGRPVLHDEIALELEHILGLKRYESIAYSLVERNGKTGLSVRPHEIAHSPPLLIPNIEINGSDPGDTRFGLGARLFLLDFGGYRSELRGDAFFGARTGASVEYFRPIRPTSRWFIAPSASAVSNLLPFYDQQKRTTEYSLRDRTVALEGGYQFNRFAEIRAGQSMNWISFRRRIGDPELPDLSLRYTATSMRFAFEGWDDPAVPRQGVQFRTAFRWIRTLNLLEQSGPQWDGSVTAFQRVSSKSSVFGGIRGSTDFERAGGSLRLFGFGGPFRLGSYGQNELFGSRGYLATAGYLREVGTLPSLFGDRIFLAGFGQYGDMFTGLQVPEQPMDLSGVLVARTVLGPVFFGGSWGNAGRQRWYFGVGRIF